MKLRDSGSVIRWRSRNRSSPEVVHEITVCSPGADHSALGGAAGEAEDHEERAAHLIT